MMLEAARGYRSVPFLNEKPRDQCEGSRRRFLRVKPNEEAVDDALSSCRNEDFRTSCGWHFHKKALRQFVAYASLARTQH